MRRPQLTPHLTMCLMGFSLLGSTSVVVPILSIYVIDVMEASIETVGLVTAVFFIVSALTKVYLGIFTGGKRTFPLMLIAFLIFTICPAFYPLIDSVGLLIFLRSARGFTSTVIGATAILLASLTVPSVERDRGVGTYAASLSLGLLAGPVITTFSIPVFGVSNTFYFASLLGLIGIFASSFLYRKVSAIEKSWQILDVSVEREDLRSKISNIARNRLFHIALIGNFAFFLLLGVISSYAPLQAKESLGFSDETVSMLFLLYYIATTAIRLLVGRIVGRIQKSTLMVTSAGFTSLLSFALFIIRDGLTFAGVFALIGAVQGVIFPVGSMLIAEAIMPSRRALANSLYLMVIDISQGMAPLITANVVIQYGLEYTFLMPAAVSAVLTLVIILLKMRESRCRSPLAST